MKVFWTIVSAVFIFLLPAIALFHFFGVVTPAFSKEEFLTFYFLFFALFVIGFLIALGLTENERIKSSQKPKTPNACGDKP